MLSVAIRVELIQKFYSSFVLWVSLLEKTLLLGFPKGPFIKVDCFSGRLITVCSIFLCCLQESFGCCNNFMVQNEG